MKSPSGPVLKIAQTKNLIKEANKTFVQDLKNLEKELKGVPIGRFVMYLEEDGFKVIGKKNIAELPQFGGTIIKRAYANDNTSIGLANEIFIQLDMNGHNKFVHVYIDFKKMTVKII